MKYRDLSVLIIESNESLRGQIVEYFAQCGVDHIAVAGSFSDARRQINKKPQLDLILFDIEVTHKNGTVENGMDFLDEIKRSKVLPLRTAYIVVTNEARYPKIYETLKQGVDAYLLKPLSLLSLGAKIDEVLKRRVPLKPIYSALECGYVESALDLAKDLYLSKKNQSAGKIVFDLLMMEDKADEARAFLLSSDQKMQPWAVLEIAKLDIKLGATAKGIQRVRELDKENPMQPEILEVLYYGLWESGEFDEALEVLESAVAIHPFNAARVQLLGLLYFKLKKAPAWKTMLKAFHLTKAGRLLNFSLLICMLLNCLEEKQEDLTQVLEYIDKGLDGSGSSLRVSVISQMLNYLTQILIKSPEDKFDINAESKELVSKINDAILDKRLDWDTAFSCLQLLNRVPQLNTYQEEFDSVLVKIVKRFGSTNGFMHSVRREVGTIAGKQDLINKALAELNSDLQNSVVNAGDANIEKAISDIFILADTFVNARALNLGIGLLHKNKKKLKEEFYENYHTKFFNLKVSGYFSGNNLFTSNRWFMNGRY